MNSFKLRRFIKRADKLWYKHCIFCGRYSGGNFISSLPSWSLGPGIIDKRYPKDDDEVRDILRNLIWIIDYIISFNLNPLLTEDEFQNHMIWDEWNDENEFSNVIKQKITEKLHKEGDKLLKKYEMLGREIGDYSMAILSRSAKNRES